MSGIAQIIQAMMSATPQVSPMGAPPGMGGGAPNVPAMGQSMNAPSFSKPQQQAGPNMQMPEIMPPAAGAPPGYPGTQQQGPPAPYQSNGQYGTQALERQYTDAVNELDRLQNPRTIGDAWESRKGIPDARTGVMQAQSNINAYNQEQAAMMAQAYAERIKAIALPVFGEEYSNHLAGMAAQNPEMGQEIMKSLETKLQELDTQEGRFKFYKEFGLPDPSAMSFAENEDINPIDVIKLLTEQTEAADMKRTEAYQMAEAFASGNSEIDAQIDALKRTMNLADQPGSIGLIGYLMSNIPETDAAKVVSAIDTQRAVVALQELFRMRTHPENKTGGALGNVSNRELELLWSSFNALNPADGKEFVRSLAGLLQKFERVKYMMRKEATYLRQMQEEKRSPAEMGEIMFREATEYVNRQTAEAMGTPVKDLQRLYENPHERDMFIKANGWAPISIIPGE